MITPGLCSVTFRSLTPTEVVEQAGRAGLKAIEWGGDVHVPEGDLRIAREVAARSHDAGLAVASYGSYLRAGRIDDPSAIDRTLETAVELGAPNVRVWAKGARAADDLAVICSAAAARELTVSLEFHPGTSTETAAGTNALLEALDALGAGNLFTYWQPDPALTGPEQLDELDAVMPRLSHLHVFRWEPDGSRLPLAEGSDLWPAALARAGAAGEGPLGGRVAFLEFVRDDDPDQLVRDAATLRNWLVP